LNCIVCGCLVDSFVDIKSQIEYFECGRCELIMKSPDNFASFEKQKMRYDLHENSADDIGYQRYFARFIDFVLPQIDGVGSALDFGCGASTLLSQMLERHGVECDYYDPIYHPDLSFKSKRYDLIVSVEVFEHLHDPRGTFKMLVNRLNHNGYLALQTEFRPSSREEFLEWYYRLDPTHILFFSPKTLETLSDTYLLKSISNNGKNIILFQKKEMKNIL